MIHFEMIMDFEVEFVHQRKVADIESKEDQLDGSLEQTEKLRASPSVLKQARKQREQMEQLKNKLKKNLQTASMSFYIGF